MFIKFNLFIKFTPNKIIKEIIGNLDKKFIKILDKSIKN